MRAWRPCAMGMNGTPREASESVEKEDKAGNEEYEEEEIRLVETL